MNQSNNNPFANLGTEGLEQAKDSLGGGGGVFESGVYTGEIKLAFAGKSDGGANFFEVHVETEGGKMYRERVYVTSKTGQNYYNPKDKSGNRDTSKKVPLPGFTVANDLALLSTGLELNAQTFEEKVVKLWDFDAKTEVPTKVWAATSMMGQQITLGILKSTVDKTKKNDSTGEYEPTGETRDENSIDKVFHAATGKTVGEFTTLGQDAIGTFRDEWAKKNAGQIRNKAKGAEGKTGAPGAAIPTGGAAAKPAKSLFGAKS